jgi:hypothetical protein
MTGVLAGRIIIHGAMNHETRPMHEAADNKGASRKTRGTSARGKLITKIVSTPKTTALTCNKSAPNPTLAQLIFANAVALAVRKASGRGRTFSYFFSQ